MKKIAHAALCLTFIAALIGVWAFRRPAATMHKAHFGFFYGFCYKAWPLGNNNYYVSIRLLQVDSSRLSDRTLYRSPIPISIAGTFPGVGTTSFTYPANADSLGVGILNLPAPPTSAIPITTNPTAVSGGPIRQMMYDIDL